MSIPQLVDIYHFTSTMVPDLSSITYTQCIVRLERIVSTSKTPRQLGRFQCLWDAHPICINDGTRLLFGSVGTEYKREGSSEECRKKETYRECVASHRSHRKAYI